MDTTNITTDMMGQGSFAGAAYGYHVHFIFGTLLLISIVLLIIWAAKSLDPKKLYKLTITLLIIGLLGWLITAPMSRWYGGWGQNSMMGNGWGMMGQGMMGQSMMNQNMMDCMQDEACHEEMETFMHRIMGIEEHNN